MVRTIVGLNNPSGRLPYTLYPANMTAARKINDYGLRNFEGLTYKWYTGRISGPALWSFGEGGSYTTFSFRWSSNNADEEGDLVLSTTAAAAEEQAEPWQPLLSHTVVVTNTGKRPGAMAEGESVIKCPSPLNVLKDTYDHSGY
jgi:hypothetical protein